MFKLIKKLDNSVRVGKLHTPHGVIQTPFFMPVATVGSVKSVAPWELEDLGAEVVLSNTYHLYLRPGEQLIKELGGLHKFMGWNRPILTDSGGYQVFSLGKKRLKVQGLRPKADQDKSLASGLRPSASLVKITEDGVEFKSHLDGSKHFFTPEKVIQIQLDLGVDILMPLDVCPSGKANREEVKRATELTVKWAERAKRYFDGKLAVSSQQLAGRQPPTANRQPLLHGIVQGGMDLELREYCAKKLMDLDFDGYSVGGLAVDLETRDMWNVVKLMGEMLPENKQRYLMGVGTPNDIITATQLGMDMFDCVLPTRMARHGSVYIKNQKSKIKMKEADLFYLPRPGATGEGRGEGNDNYELVNLLKSEYRTDSNPIEEGCKCPSCSRDFSRAYISHLLRSNEILGLRLATLHNLHTYLELMRKLKK